MAKRFEPDDWKDQKDRIIGLGERSFHKSYYPQLRQNLDRLERFRALLDHTSDFVILVALPEGLVEDVNAALGRLFGQPGESLIGKPFAALGIADAMPVLEALREDCATKDIGQEMPSHTLVTQVGVGERRLWLDLSYRVAMADQRCHGVLVGRDITERKNAADRISFLTYHDALTKLPNQLLFKDRFQQAMAFADRDAGKLALIVIDLDQFKAVNDSLGHSVGDQLLVEVANRLTSRVRETDTVSRQGGDEFLILLPNLADPEICATFIRELLVELNEPFSIDGRELITSISVGVSVYPDDGGDFETLLKKADVAMYRAKEAGRNTYRFFNEEMNAEAIEQLTIHFGLRRALETGQFVLHYQPQIEVVSGALIGAEALIRWNHPEAGLIPPNRFIPVAEENGLIVDIGDWVLREACQEAAKWRCAGMLEPVVAVNLSGLQFKRGNIEASVAQALGQSGISPEMLELELTESILIRDTENVLATVKRLKQMGIRLSIDDFGTGYSSLSYLKRFEVDKLKIDQSFIRDLVSDPENAAIVRAIIQMARSLGLSTIAEGVEDKKMLDYLRIYHCDEAQGYYFSRPLPAHEFMDYLALRLKNSSAA